MEGLYISLATLPTLKRLAPSLTIIRQSNWRMKLRGKMISDRYYIDTT
jgi:hypothetical protein